MLLRLHQKRLIMVFKERLNMVQKKRLEDRLLMVNSLHILVRSSGPGIFVQITNLSGPEIPAQINGSEHCQPSSRPFSFACEPTIIEHSNMYTHDGHSFDELDYEVSLLRV